MYRHSFAPFLAVSAIILVTASGCGTRVDEAPDAAGPPDGPAPDAPAAAAADAAAPPDAVAPPDAEPVGCDGNEDCQTPPANCLEPGTCNLDTGTCIFPVTDCSSMNGECSAGTCNPATGACEALPDNEDDSCGAGTVCSGYGACQGFADTCDESGTQSRSCTDYTCQAGTCSPGTPYDDSRACTIDTDGDACGADVTSNCGACGGFSGGTCDETGTRSCTCTSFACAAGTCQPTSTACTQSCTRDTDGDSCGDNEVTSCGACGGFTAGTCDETGTQSCTCTSYECAAGACQPSSNSCSAACTRDTDGVQCAPDSVTGCSACNFTGGTCDETGNQSCTCTSYACEAASCTANPSSCSQSCSRDTDGDQCSSYNCGTPSEPKVQRVCCAGGQCNDDCGACF